MEVPTRDFIYATFSKHGTINTNSYQPKIDSGSAYYCIIHYQSNRGVSWEDFNHINVSIMAQKHFCNHKGKRLGRRGMTHAEPGRGHGAVQGMSGEWAGEHGAMRWGLHGTALPLLRQHQGQHQIRQSCRPLWPHFPSLPLRGLWGIRQKGVQGAATLRMWGRRWHHFRSSLRGLTQLCAWSCTLARTMHVFVRTV